MARAYSIIFIIPRSAQKDEFSSSERERETIFPLDIKIAWLLNAVFFCSLLFRVRLWGSLKSRSTRRTDAAAPSAVVYIYLLREVHAISDFVESHKTSASSSRKEKEKELWPLPLMRGVRDMITGHLGCKLQMKNHATLLFIINFINFLYTPAHYLYFHLAAARRGCRKKHSHIRLVWWWWCQCWK